MNFEAAAEEAFQILRSYNYEVLLFDEEHNQVFEPVDARRFFAKPANLLVSIIDEGEDSAIRLYLSKSMAPSSVMGLISGLRSMATKYKMVFHVRKYERDLAPKDFATQASVSEGHNNKKEVPQMNIVEGMYGTSRSSYLKLENARMIVRHSAKINENVLGARGRNIDAIYIENAVGERHLFPTTQLAPARALTHHVDQGGSWADTIGEQIGRMAQDFASVGSAIRHVNFYGNDLVEAAHDVRSTLRESARGMRQIFEAFGRKTRYADVCESLNEMAAQPLTEGEDDTTRISELASILNTDAVQLSENVLGVVARVLENRLYNAPKLGKEREVPTVSILGKPVSVEAWDAFKKGQLELMVKPDLSSVPSFRDPTQRRLYAFAAVAKAAKDNSMSNLLSFVANKLDAMGPEGGVVDSGTDTTRRMQAASGPKRGAQQNAEYRGLMMIVTQALRAAGVEGKPSGVTEVARGSGAIKAFEDWARGFSLPAILDTDPLDGLEGMEGFGSTETDESVDLDAGDAFAPEIEENCGLCDGDEEPVDDVLTDWNDDDAVLTREDVLLPRNQGEDLISQVSTSTVVDPDSGEEKAPDDGYISRLLALSGRGARR